VNIAVRALLVALGLIALGGQAAAQVTMPPDSTRGLFGSGSGADAKTILDLRASVIEGYDTDLPQSLVSTIDPLSLQTEGFSTLFDTGATYAWRKNKTEVGANAMSVLRYYTDLGSAKSVGHSAGFGVTTTTLGGTTLFVNQSAAFTPTYLYGLFPSTIAIDAIEPGDPGVTAPDYVVNDLQSYVYTTTMALSHSLGRRNSISGTGEFSYTDRLAETETWSDISSYAVRGRYTRNTTRNTALSTELRYRSGEFGYRGSGIITEVALDVGVDYDKPLSATRRASLDVRVGVSGTDYPGSAFGQIGFQRQYRTTGEVAFSYPFSQTWTASATVRRGLEYATDLPTPVVTNGAIASVTGLLTRRVDVSILAAYASGESILNRNTLFFDTYTGDVRVRFAVSRTLALFAEYLYYYYDFQNGALLLPIPPGLERNGVRAGLTLWMPALRR
jgi:hypothetical protein